MNDQDSQVVASIEDSHNIPDEEDLFTIPASHTSCDIGPIFLEGILHDISPGQDSSAMTNDCLTHLRQDLEKRISSISFTFELSKDILADSDGQ